jgi:integrase
MTAAAIVPQRAAAAPPTSSSLFAARRKLRAALDAIDHPDATVIEARKAHVMATGATAVLVQHLLVRAATDAEDHRRHATALAKNLRDSRGRRRTPVTMPGYHKGRAPASKGIKYKKTPPTINETLRMLALVPTMRVVESGECPSCHQAWRKPHLQECINPYAERFKALIFILWRCGLRIGCEALRLTEHDLYPPDGYLYVAEGKNSEAGEVAVDDWLWPLLDPWLTFRQAYPPGPLFCAMEGPNAGLHAWSGPNIRLNLKRLAQRAGIRHRVHPHGWRHAMALEQRDEGHDTLVISRNLRHKNIGTTHVYFEGFPQSRVISELRARPVPKVSMFDMLRNEGFAISDRPEHRRGLTELPVPTVRDAAGSAVTPDLMRVLSRA